jgi:hypothetical protein
MINEEDGVIPPRKPGEWLFLTLASREVEVTNLRPNGVRIQVRNGIWYVCSDGRIKPKTALRLGEEIIELRGAGEGDCLSVYDREDPKHLRELIWHVALVVSFLNGNSCSNFVSRHRGKLDNLANKAASSKDDGKLKVLQGLVEQIASLASEFKT